jgi:hypothetical protein
MKSVNCAACNRIFIPKYHGRGKSCSRACSNILISRFKQKYTAQQIDKVIELKKIGTINLEIAKISGVKISKIKEIIKENNLFLTKEERQKHAYEAKLAKNPNAMVDMRKAYNTLVTSDAALESVKTKIAECGYEYVKGFESISKPFTVKCNTCNKNKTISKINTLIKDSCANCSGNGTSKPEKEIAEWIYSLGLRSEKFKFEKRAGGREIDIYVPSVKIGIEYCGLYWHNENSPSPREKFYHRNKMDKANKEGIRLITIFQDEWAHKGPQVRNFVKSALGISDSIIFARKCEIYEISRKEANKFLNETHIQGSGKTKIAFGIFYSEELVGVMTGGDHHRTGNKGSLILNRLSFKDGTSVIGGASRLLSRLIKYAKQNRYSKVVSWSDNRWSEGNVYRELNFILEEELDPDYSYVNGQERTPKQSCKKKDLIALGAKGQTELELANSLGYKRIWDCGKKRWILELK